MPRNIYITADDFGLTEEISKGIVVCANESLIDGTALLVNAPATDFAINQIPKIPHIEVGIHLSLVEGFSLTGNKTLLSRDNYFYGQDCLHLNWKKFIKLYLTRKISLHELEEELESQIEKFKTQVGSIPFANSTQHLHVLPGVSKMITKLCEKHQIPKMRNSQVSYQELIFTKQKIFGSLFLNYCSRISRIKIPDLGKTYGITVSGQIDERFMHFIIEAKKKKNIELVMHPGLYSEALKKDLHESYHNFDWEKELNSLRYLKAIAYA